MHSTVFDPREDALREIAMAFPEATEDFPWGHRAIKVRGKAFVFMGATEQGFSMSLKLPRSRDEALALPGAEPTGYGLGKSNWVSISFPPEVEPPMDQLRAWIEESYRAIAPKRLSAKLPAGGAQ